MSNYVAKLKEKVGQLVEEVLQFNDAEFVYFMNEICARRPPDPEPVEFEEEHFFLGLAFRRWMYDDEPDVKVEGWSPWETQAVAPPDAEFYSYRGETAFLGYDTGLDEHGQCENCGTLVRAGAKLVACPVCGVKVTLT